MKKKIDMKSLLNSMLLGNKSYLILIVLVIVVSMITPIFFTPINLLNVLRQVSVTAIAAFAFTMILGMAEIDLSVGMILCFGGVIVAKALVAGVPIPLAILITVGMGIVMGALNAFLINTFKLVPFIVTLATSYVFKGTAHVMTGNVSISGLPNAFNFFGQGSVGPVPFPIIIMLVMLVIMWTIVNRTKFGRQAIAMGGNIEAARVSGVRTNMVRMGVYITVGIFTTIAAVIQTSRSASAQLTAGEDLPMDAIAAVVIGGTSMNGGNANVIGTVIGCLIVGIVNNSLNLLHVDANWQITAKGVLILFAVILDAVTSRIYEKLSKKRLYERA